MTSIDDQRVALRRETYDINEALSDLLARLSPHDAQTAQAVRKARSALFEAWTILCMPPDDHDDDHPEH